LAQAALPAAARPPCGRAAPRARMARAVAPLVALALGASAWDTRDIILQGFNTTDCTGDVDFEYHIVAGTDVSYGPCLQPYGGLQNEFRMVCDGPELFIQIDGCLSPYRYYFVPLQGYYLFQGDCAEVKETITGQGEEYELRSFKIPVNIPSFGGTPPCTLTSPLAAGSDPVTYYNNIRREFWLPDGMLMPLLRTPDLVVHGATFAGGPSEQWFDQFSITGKGGKHLLWVAIRKDIANFNRSAAPPGSFETLEVVVDGTTPLPIMPRAEDVLNKGGIMIAFRRVSGHHHLQQWRIGRAARECVEVAGGYVHFTICSAAAVEYYGARQHLAVEYAHLDLAVFRMQHPELFRGILPELWGLQPMSSSTRAFTEKAETGSPPPALAHDPAEVDQQPGGLHGGDPPSTTGSPIPDSDENSTCGLVITDHGCKSIGGDGIGGTW